MKTQTHWILRQAWVLCVAICGFANVAAADTIMFNGAITQSTQDGTGPAVNNFGLNLIQDGDAFLVTLNFAGAITSASPVPHDLSAGTLTFLDSTQAVTEIAFDTISLTVLADGAFDDLSLLGCLTPGSGCAFGNFLTVNFQIMATALNLQNVAGNELDQPHPLDLLEDDGVTDIHGVITTYSYIGTTGTTVPEPSSMLLLGCGLVIGAIGRRSRKKRRRAGCCSERVNSTDTELEEII